MSSIRRTTAVLAVVGLLGASALSTGAAAQTSSIASINAIANVIGVAPLEAAGIQDLTFGTVNAGTSAGPVNVGRFSVSGEPNSGVSISFDLPDVLTSSGGTTIPIVFNSGDGAIFSVFPTVLTAFNPNSVFATVLSGTGNLSIGISGTVSPPLGTTSGTYEGTITLTVSY